MPNSSSVTDSLRVSNELKCQYKDDFNKSSLIIKRRMEK